MGLVRAVRGLVKGQAGLVRAGRAGCSPWLRRAGAASSQVCHAGQGLQDRDCPAVPVQSQRWMVWGSEGCWTQPRTVGALRPQDPAAALLPLLGGTGWGLLSSAMAAAFAPWPQALWARQHRDSSSVSLPAGAAPALPAPQGPVPLPGTASLWHHDSAGPDQAALVLLSLSLLCFVPWTQSCSQGAPHSSSAVKGKEGAWEDSL